MTKEEFKKCFLSIIYNSILFNDDYIKSFKKNFKLNEKPQLTDRERAYLKAYSYDYEWVARDKDGCISVYKSKPQRGRDYWNNGAKFRGIHEDLLDFIKWEDEEPYKIKDLLGEE